MYVIGPIKIIPLLLGKPDYSTVQIILGLITNKFQMLSSNKMQAIVFDSKSDNIYLPFRTEKSQRCMQNFVIPKFT